MPGIHKNKTISFRPSDWERNIIEEKAAVSGWAKKDFIARSCIYSSVCVVGNKKNIQRIIDSLEEVRNVMIEISSRISTGDFPMSEDNFEVMAKRYLALCSAIAEIADGASYLFGVEKSKSSSVLEKQERLKQFCKSVLLDTQDGDKKPTRGDLGAKNSETPETGETKVYNID